jgi:outer membrane protein assembly factor BamB
MSRLTSARAAPLPLCSLATAVLLALPGSPARAEDVAFSTLAGTWQGEATHRGQRTPLWLEVGTEGEKQVAKLTIPAAGLYGLARPARIAGSSLLVGESGLPFAYDAGAGTLTAVLPKSMVPVYRIEAVFHRTDAAPPKAPAADPLPPAPAPAWTRRLDGPVWAGIAHDAASGLVLVGTDAGSLFALRASDGREAWRARTGGAIRARPAVSGGDVYALSDDGFLYKLALRTGKRLWRSRVDRGDYVRLPGTDPKSRWDRYGSTPLVGAGRVYVGSRDGALVALDAATGARRWSAPAGDMVTAGPAALGDAVFFASYDGKVRAVGAADGKLRWQWDGQIAIPNDVVVADGRVLVGSRAYDLTALDPADGKPIWQYYYWFSWVESPPRVRDGVAYVGSSDAVKMFAFDARDGKLRWERPVPGWSWSQPAVLGELVFAGTIGAVGYPIPRAGALVAIDRASGAVRWAHRPEPPQQGEWGYAAAPAIAGERVVAADLAGVVRAFPAQGGAERGVRSGAPP